MTEFNLNYENISVDYNANKEDTAGGNTLGGGDIILVDIHGGEGGSFAEIDESNLAGGGKTIAGWGVGGIEADDGGGDDAPDSILWDLDGGHVTDGDGDFILVDLVGAPATIDDAADQEIGGDIILVDIVGTSDGGAGRSSTDGGGHDPIADMLSRQENVSMEGRESLDAAGLDVVIGSATTENSAEGGMLMLVDSFDSEQDYQTSAEPYGQFNFTVEMGGDASTGPADAFFVSTDASTVTESAPATGQEIGGGEIILVDIRGGEGGYAESEERGLGGVTIYSDINDDPSGQNDSFDFTAQPGNQEVPVPPDEIIIMPDPTCPPEQILDDRGYTDFLGQEGDSAASGGGGDFILVDILPPLVTSGVDDLGLI